MSDLAIATQNSHGVAEWHSHRNTVTVGANCGQMCNRRGHILLEILISINLEIVLDLGT